MIYLVSTPIGNLSDITQRALDTLKSVDVIASEDTRHTGRLLQHFGIEKPQISFHEHNELEALERIAGLVEQGKSVALVTDAGTPAISDPGYRLVDRAIRSGWKLTSIPGPTAFVAALIISGLPVHSLTFRGFPPRKSGARSRFLAADKDSPYTLIYYESPFRIQQFLADALKIFGDRPAVIVNDLTKLFETVHRGRLSELLEKYKTIKVQGEFTVLIHGSDTKKYEPDNPADDE
jgi:16S rRNA (cytidine1402-2'-O)-methyltransferase